MEPLRVSELLELSGSPEAFLASLGDLKLTYGHITGSPRLRAAVASLYGGTISDADVLVASGAIGANFLVYYTLVEAGDTVISVSPTYQQLYSVSESLGATVKILPLRRDVGYLPDVDELRSLVDAKTRLIIINNPNNPTGSLMDESLLREIATVAGEIGAYVHCDEVYRGLDMRRRRQLLRLSPSSRMASAPGACPRPSHWRGYAPAGSSRAPRSWLVFLSIGTTPPSAVGPLTTRSPLSRSRTLA